MHSGILWYYGPHRGSLPPDGCTSGTTATKGIVNGTPATDASSLLLHIWTALLEMRQRRHHVHIYVSSFVGKMLPLNPSEISFMSQSARRSRSTSHVSGCPLMLWHTVYRYADTSSSSTLPVNVPTSKARLPSRCHGDVLGRLVNVRDDTGSRIVKWTRPPFCGESVFDVGPQRPEGLQKVSRRSPEGHGVLLPEHAAEMKLPVVENNHINNTQFVKILV